MKIHEDRSHMNIDTRWFEKGYAKEDVHSLRLQSLCTEAEAAANKQFYDSHTCEEWETKVSISPRTGTLHCSDPPNPENAFFYAPLHK